MLQSIRDRASGVIAYVIVILISIPFALWGINQYFGGGGNLVAAEVNGKEIPVSAFINRYQEQRRYLQSMLGGQLPPGYSEESLKKDVIRSMVRDELLREELDRAGYRVSDQLVFDYVRSLPVFSTDGHFDPERYSRILEAQRRPKAQFENEVRQQLRRTQFEQGVKTSAFVPPATAEAYAALDGQQREAEYFLIKVDSNAIREAISDDEVAAYYKEHKSSFLTPERIKVAYVALSQENLEKRVSVDEEQLRAFFQDQADRYAKLEQRHVRHILVKSQAEGDAPGAAKEAARKRAEEGLRELRSGRDFAELAKEYSGDTLTADKGGDLGWVVRGDFGPKVDEVIFALQPGTYSEPVETPSGWDIFEVLEVKPRTQRPFEEVRSEVERDYKRHEAENLFEDLTERLATLSYEQAGSLEPAADALGVPIETTDWFERDKGTGVAELPAVRAAAFSEEVLNEGRNSELIETAPGTVLVLRIADHEPPAPRPLEEVAQQIRATLARKTAREQAMQRGQAAIKRLKAGESPEVVAQTYGAELKKTGFVSRHTKDQPAYLVSKLFTLPPPSPGQPVIDGVPTPDGAYAVIVLTGLREGAVDDQERQSAADRLTAAYGPAELKAIVDSLVEHAEVRIYDQNL